jgi:CHAT domain-containing protein
LETGTRFQSSKQQGDLEQSILHFTEAICLPLTRETPAEFLNIVKAFYYLTLSVCFRAKQPNWSEDVKCCIRFFRYLHRQWHHASTGFPIPVTTTLVHALAKQVELELGDVDEDIEEMTDLCDELLNSDIPIQSLTNAITDFARAIYFHLCKDPFGWKIRSEKVTACLRRAIVCLPGLDPVPIALARSLLSRFVVAHSDDDYEEGMITLDRIHGPGDEPSPYAALCLALAAGFAEARFRAYGKPADLEHAIYRYRTLIDEASMQDPLRTVTIKYLSSLEGLRLDGTANIQDMLSILPETEKPSSFRDLIASFPEVVAVNPNPIRSFKEHIYGLHASYINQLTDIANIEDGIKYCQLVLISYPRSDLASPTLLGLGRLLNRAFECTHKIRYLNEAISATRDGVNTANLLDFRFACLARLITFLSTRLKLLWQKEDFHELMQLYPTAVDCSPAFSRGHLPGHLLISFDWAALARRFGHPSTSTAYEHAMSSIQASLTFAPTLDKQHSRLVSADGVLQPIPLDYASYHIDTGHLDQATETLERGRGLLWSEMRGLRTSVDQIRLADPNLAENFSMVNRELEALTLTLLLNNSVEGNNDLARVDPYGHSVIRKQKLLDDREKLITQIRALSGFDTFLKPPSFNTLRSAASHGPVVIINHCKWRSDIIILLHDSPPSLISTSDDFYIRAKKLQDQLLRERKKGLESDAYEYALRAVLKELYDLVGRPVIKRLNELEIPEQSRVWWCPTSVFCSRPLHAMGPIPADVGPPRYFLDLYIPSYTPSLSALIDSHKPNSQIIEKPSMLLVLQPDASMVRALDEMKAVQRVCSQATTLIGATATPSVVLQRLRDHRFAHIVCHGLLEPGEPFNSSFKLYQGKRLSLIDIVRSQLPNAEFAFLAACHTAELTNKSPVDEALHLAAAMQYCGFRSVVGTMWAMADTDGRDLAENVYRSVFSGRKRRVYYYERTAEALRDAVVKLRRKQGRGMTLERWVNYVHYGA